MKRFILSLIGLFLCLNISYAGTITPHTVYGTNSEVTSTTLNGNITAITNEVNGGLDNDNSDVTAGFRFYEVKGSLPAASVQGRMIYLTSDDVLYADSGTAFTGLVGLGGTQTITGNKTFSGTTTTANIAATGTSQFNNSGNANVIDLLNGGTASGLSITQSVATTANLNAIRVYSNVTQGAAALVYFEQSDVSTDQATLELKNDGTGANIFTNAGHGIRLGTNALNNEIDAQTHGDGTVTMYIGTYTIDVTIPSDEIVKKNIKDVDSQLDKLNNLKVKKFKFKKEYVNDGEKEHTGMIAQEVKEIFPEVVFERTDGLMAVNYKDLIPSMIKAIQELSDKNDALEARIIALEAR